MLVIPVKNAHELVHDACHRLIVDGADEGDNRSLRVPACYVVEHTAHSAPLWATCDPFEAFSNRIAFACAQGTTAGFLDAAKHLAEGDSQVVLATAMGRAAFWRGSSGLETMTWEPSFDPTNQDAMPAAFLSELLASAGGMPLGKTWASTPALCVSKARLPVMQAIATLPLRDPYEHMARVGPADPAGLLEELLMLLQEGSALGLKHHYTRRVAVPILTAGQFLNSDLPKRFDAAREMLATCESVDWREACGRWVARLQKAARG